MASDEITLCNYCEIFIILYILIVSLLPYKFSCNDAGVAVMSIVALIIQHVQERCSGKLTGIVSSN